MVDPVRAIGNLVFPGQELAQPGDLFVVVVLARPLAAFLVTPVGSDAQFGVLVHFLSANLDFQAAPVRTMHGRMQRAVVIAFGIRDVVVEFLGDRRPQVMHDAECGVAILQVIDNDAQGAHVIDLGKLDALFPHLVPDAVDVLRSTVNFGVFHPERLKLLAHLRHRISDELFALAALLVEHFGDALVDIGMQETEGQILQFPLQLPNAEPIGQRRVEFQRLTGHLHAQVVRIGGVEAQGLRPAGQTQQHDANVLDHGEQHLAQHFDLRLHLDRVHFARLEVGSDKTAGNRPQLVEPGNTLNEVRRRFAETLLNDRHGVFFQRRDGEENGRHARFGIEFQAGDNDRHTQRVRPDAFATPQFFVAIGLPGILDSLAQTPSLIGLQTCGQGSQEMFEVALGGDRMDNGNHPVIIPSEGLPPPQA